MPQIHFPDDLDRKLAEISPEELQGGRKTQLRVIYHIREYLAILESESETEEEVE